VRNARDVGGYPTASGSAVRWRTLLRTAKLSHLSDADRSYLAEEIGLRTVIDLRMAVEVAEEPDALDGLDVAWHNFQPLIADGPWIEGMADLYRYTIDERGGEYAGAVRELARPGALPALVHCTAGKDRTGLLIALVLTVLGVEESVIVEDYMRSNVELGLGDADVNSAAYTTIVPEYLTATLAHVRERFGDAAGFFRAHGIAEEELDALRGALLD
jgi:protein-tyrosine phosphatase